MLHLALDPLIYKPQHVAPTCNLPGCNNPPPFRGDVAGCTSVEKKQ